MKRKLKELREIYWYLLENNGASDAAFIKAELRAAGYDVALEGEDTPDVDIETSYGESL